MTVISSNGIGGGTFATGASWAGGVAPGTGDQAHVLATDTMTLAADRTIGSLWNEGIIVGAGFKLTLDTTVATIIYENDGTISGVLDITITSQTTGFLDSGGGTGNIRNLVINHASADVRSHSPPTTTTLDGTFTLTAGAFSPSNNFTVTGASSITGTFTPAAGKTFIANGAITIAGGGIFGSNTAWTFTQKNSLRIEGTFNAPNATGTWTWDGTGTHINGSGTFNHDSGTLVITAGATGLGGYAAIGNGNPSWTWNNITNNSGTTTGWQAGTVGVDGTLTASAGSSFFFDATLRNITATFGTASAAGRITGAGILNLSQGANGSLVTVKATSSAFPWLADMATLTWNPSNTVSYLFRSGTMTPAATTGTAAASTITSESMTWIGAVVVSVGDTWKSMSSNYRGGFTTNGVTSSVNHNGINGLYVYGKAGYLKLSDLNDAQYCPKNGSSIYVAQGELYVDRGPFNETLTPTTAPVQRYILSDAAHAANANLYFADGIQVRLPKSWNRRGIGVLGGSRVNVAFRCVFGYGFEGETAGSNPALGTTTEGAGGGAIDVVASNPETGLNSMEFNQPAAASGTTNWTSPVLTPIKKGICRISVYTHSSMAGASTIEAVEVMGYLQNTLGQQIHIIMTYVSAGVYKIRFSTDNATFNDFTVAQTYAASTRYELVAGFDFVAALYSFFVNGVLAQANCGMWARNNAEKLYFESSAAQDSHIYVDNILICDTGTETVAKAQSGGWADLDDANLMTPTESPAHNYRIPVCDVPAGVIA